MKRIITIQDVSCVGKCSLTVALPIISAAGVEAGVLPTAVLSTHTQFAKFTFCDLTDEIEKISDTFHELAIDFDAIYTGYLGSFRQLGLVADFFDRFGDGAVKVVDPVMADNGVLYKGFTPEFALAMADLCKKADLIIPNLTEASFMLGIEYNPNYDEAYIRDVLKRLTDLGCPSAALSGISFEEGKIGVYHYNASTDTYYYYAGEKLPVQFHGTGDIFTAVCAGALALGESWETALEKAANFVLRCMEETAKESRDKRYGVCFEKALPYLWNN